jgi:photosystem II stability/assembly factor-like uncharacterized protein
MDLYLGTDDGLAVFEGQQEEWRPRYLRLQGHRVTAVTALGRQAWAGTTDGLWRSHDGGETWSPANTGLSVRHLRALAVCPAQRSTRLLLAGTEPAAIFVSRDGGETWAEAPDVARLRDAHAWSLPYSPAAGCVRDFSVGERLYAAAEVGGVLRSDDAGATWELLEGGCHADVHALVRHPAHPGQIYAATGGGRYRSHDGGEHWELVGEGYTRAVWVDPGRPESVLSGPARYVGAMGRVERSTDAGDTWSLSSDGLDIPMNDMIERFASAGAHVLALTSEGALYTARRGVWVWRPLNLGLPPVHAVEAVKRKT